MLESAERSVSRVGLGDQEQRHMLSVKNKYRGSDPPTENAGVGFQEAS